MASEFTRLLVRVTVNAPLLRLLLV